MKLPHNDRLIRVACYLALAALPLMVWSVIDPTVWPVLVALSVGQGIGTLSFLIFVFVVLRDMRLASIARRSSLPPPPSSRRDAG